LICPKCGAEQKEGRQECLRCGVIFAKLAGSEAHAAPPGGEPSAKPDQAALEKSGPEKIGQIEAFFFGSDREENPFVWGGRVLVYLVIFIWGWTFILTPMASDYFAQTFLHNVNLAFHEAGHVFFGLFGEFIGILGGTLAQILMPLVCLGAFLFHRNPFAASAALWWTAESFMDIAPYINDARALSIPLVGGNIGLDNPDMHDWHHLLRDLGMLKYDHTLALLSNRVGVLLMIVSFAWGAYVLYRQHKTMRWGRLSE